MTGAQNIMIELDEEYFDLNRITLLQETIKKMKNGVGLDIELIEDNKIIIIKNNKMIKGISYLWCDQ